MAKAPQDTRPTRDWRLPAAIGAAVGLALPVSRGVSSALEPSLGYGWAWVLSLVAAAVAGGGVALVACSLFKPSGDGHA